MRAARALTKKLPKPVMATESPLANAPEIALVVASKALAASAFDLSYQQLLKLNLICSFVNSLIFRKIYVKPTGIFKVKFDYPFINPYVKGLSNIDNWFLDKKIYNAFK